MSPYKPMEDGDKPAFSDKMFACPLKGHWISFQLVDEFGEGKPYAGLAYTLQDSAEQQYTGVLDAEGFAKIEDCYRGPVVLTVDSEYQGGVDIWYEKIVDRKSYPLPITELQVRAEQTRFFHKDGFPVDHNPAQKAGDKFIQVEVRDLVKHRAHLPPPVDRKYPPDDDLMRLSQRQEPSTWLAEQLSQAQQWGWSAPEQVHFLIVNKLNETELPIIKNWLPLAGVAPQVHFERLFDEAKFWSREHSE